MTCFSRLVTTIIDYRISLLTVVRFIISGDSGPKWRICLPFRLNWYAISPRRVPGKGVKKAAARHRAAAFVIETELKRSAGRE